MTQDVQLAGKLITKYNGVTVDEYGSHLPFLAWIGKHITPIRGVLELGAGKFSTPLWLDRSVFPDVEHVVCVEQDEAWLPRIADSRLQVVHTDVKVFAQALYNTEPYDLIFIDNGSGLTGEDERVLTIRAVMRLPQLPLVVVHDWENRRYQEEARHVYDWLIADEAQPQTALLIRRVQPW